MASNAATREGRIEIRATKEEKRILVAAAVEERLDLTGFIMRRVLPAARELVDLSERLVLSERDSARVLDLLENPPKSMRALLNAARRRRSRKRRLHSTGVKSLSPTTMPAKISIAAL